MQNICTNNNLFNVAWTRRRNRKCWHKTVIWINDMISEWWSDFPPPPSKVNDKNQVIEMKSLKLHVMTSIWWLGYEKSSLFELWENICAKHFITTQVKKNPFNVDFNNKKPLFMQLLIEQLLIAYYFLFSILVPMLWYFYPQNNKKKHIAPYWRYLESKTENKL